MVMKNGMGPSEDALKQERLIVEVASGIKMLELGLPARLSDKSLELVDYWNRELKENPNLVDALESDVNNALEVIHKAERGEKIEYATMRNRRQTSDMQAQLPKHFYVADEIRKHPNKEDKTIVIVIDPSSKSADVILPQCPAVLVVLNHLCLVEADFVRPFDRRRYVQCGEHLQRPVLQPGQ